MTAMVIGVGNPFRCDDGAGPAVVDLLRRTGIPGVTLEYSLGATADLIELWSGVPRVIVVDAVRSGPAHTGRIHHLSVPDVHTERIRAASSHGLDLGEAVELARVLHRLPQRLELFAIEVERVGYGQGLSPPVAAAAAQVAARIAEMLTTAAVT